MKKLSAINEGLWKASIRRSSTDEIRKEDKHRFTEPFKKIIESEHIDLNLTNGVIWTPFNFGSDSVDKPGYYMDVDDLKELVEFLKDTDYRIADNNDFRYLKDCYSNWVQEKVGNYYGVNIHNIHILNFGYISSGLAYRDIVGTGKDDTIIYGACEKIGDEYKQKAIQIRSEKLGGWFYTGGGDKIQVRLIKYK